MTRRATLVHDWFPRPLPANVTLGERSWLYSSLAFLHYRSLASRGVRVGHDTGIYWGTFFELGPRGQLEIGDYCTLVSPIIAVNSRVTIGSYTFISFDVTIADSHDATPPDGGQEAIHSATSGVTDGRHAGAPSIVLEENVWIGTRAVLLPGARLGEGAIVGAAAVVDFEVPEYAVVAGNPAQVVGSAPRRRRCR